jgi:hypothetical protein
MTDPAILTEVDDVHVRFCSTDILRTECLTHVLK